MVSKISILMLRKKIQLTQKRNCKYKKWIKNNLTDKANINYLLLLDQ